MLTLASVVWSTLRFDISPMPSSAQARRAILSWIPADTTGEIYELGAGWGSLAFPIARQCPRAHIIALEGSPVPYLVCWLRKLLRPAPNLTLRFGDFSEVDLTQASGVVTYLWTGGMAQLGSKLSALKSGSWVISSTFAWRGREATDERTLDDLWRTKIYRYVL
ncbi:MAG: SAM-dependent methyltransferase [Deltaproteobacteria bacterium]|nr:SAM-dependent methyltransferase [Deltaproteobacteria bacterium]